MLALILSACSSAPPATYVSSDSVSSDSAEPQEESAAETVLVGDACALLDEAFLDAALASVEAPFGGQLDFQQPLQTPPSAYYSWKDPSIPVEIQIYLEDAATAELDDHRDRAFTLDVDPVVEPQDGPGEKAVILLDPAFEKLGSEPLPYGYFFVEGGLAVFVNVTFVDIGPELLRDVANEVDARIQEL